LNGYSARLTGKQLAAVRKDRDVDYVAPDVIFTPDDIQTPTPSWGLDRIDQAALPLDGQYHFSPNPGAGVTAYVIDSGVRGSHAQFAGRLLPGFSAIADGRGTNDCHGHGTHVAGTLGGAGFGVAKAVNIVPVRIAGCDGKATSSSVVAGIDWMIRDRAQRGGKAVANFSYGHRIRWYELRFPQESAVRRAVANGITFVISAGNDNADACGYSPARVREALTIGATDATDARAGWTVGEPYSNYGDCLDLFAPGHLIASAGHTGDTQQATKSGTSMAAPHVAGAAARFLAENPTADPSIVAASLKSLATPGVVGNAGSRSLNRLLRVTVPVPATSQVPAVVGVSCAVASAEVREVGLVPLCVGSGSWVGAQAPQAGAMVPRGTTVRLSMMSGPIP
jgi:subtilisin family serine protease